MKYLLIIVTIAIAQGVHAQSLSARSNELIVDFSDPRNDHSVSMSTINWLAPIDSATHIKEGTIAILAEVRSMYGTLTTKLRVKDLKADKILNEFKIPIDEETKTNVRIERTLTLPIGEYEIEILAENLEGFSVRTTRTVISEKK